ncbi:MAG TPA: hypothetical protein EYP85_16315 [Armatimonadetes bacterium]|nr:hypothetical protein [Armatimonadota bacterium]
MARSEAFDPGRFRYGLYYFCTVPLHLKEGQVVYEVSKPEWVDKMFRRVARAGVNMMTYANVVRYPYGAVYPSEHPDIPLRAVWRELGLDPVQMFLNACQRYHLEAYLTAYIPPAGPEAPVDQAYVRRVAADIIARYGQHPAFTGYCPNVEAAPHTGTTHEQYHELLGYVKSLQPDLQTIDYPAGPYYASTLETVLAHSRSEHLDLQNVQLRLAFDVPFLREFALLRGIVSLTEALAAGKPTLIHTHYMHMPENMPLRHAYFVSQGAILTATKDGCHQFSYLHFFHGVGNVDGLDTLWRWRAWLEGILSVQRLEPYYAGATNVARVGIILPRYHVPWGALPERPALERPVCQWVAMVWQPLQRAHLPVRYFFRPPEVEGFEVIVMPLLTGYTREQTAALEAFVKQGGSLIALGAPLPSPPTKEYIKRFQPHPAAWELSPEMQQLLGVEFGEERKGEVMLTQSIPQVPTSFWPGVEATTLNLSPAAIPLAQWADGQTAASRIQQGKGEVICLPRAYPLCAHLLPALVRSRLREGIEVYGLPPNYIVEHYKKQRGSLSHHLVLLLGSQPGDRAFAVTLNLPCPRPPKYAFFVDDQGAKALATKFSQGKVSCHLDQVANNWGAVLLADNTYPLLLPLQKEVTCDKTDEVELQCLLVNLTSKSLAGQLTVEVPEHMQVRTGGTQSYELKPGASRIFTCRVACSPEIEKEAQIVLFKTLGLVQRTVVVPLNGKQRRVSDAVPTVPLAPGGELGRNWTILIAGEEADSDDRVHSPGVNFVRDGQWSKPKNYKGRMARFGRTLPGRGGPNFALNTPPVGKDIEVSLHLFCPSRAEVRVFDGRAYRTIGKVEPAPSWREQSFVVPGKMVADYLRTTSKTLLFEIDSPGVYLHTIRARVLD